jgi:hypothetical protein
VRKFYCIMQPKAEAAGLPAEASAKAGAKEKEAAE